jgi:peptidyl-prolyl cis-trans isomerase SurA
MRKVLIEVAMGLVLATLPARAADVLDRIVATVNGRIILQSDWEDDIRFESIIGARPLSQLTPEDEQGALDRLIDQELLSEQVRTSELPPPSEEEVAKRIEQIRKQYPDASTEEEWQAVLARFGLTEAQLKTHITAEIDLLWRVDARLRPTVNIDAKNIETYYNEELLPQLRQSGAKEVPLIQVTPKIRELLTQQKIDQLLKTWLLSLRSSSTINTNDFSVDSKARAQ